MCVTVLNLVKVVQPLPVFKMAAVCHLEFLKIRFFTVSTVRFRGQYASSCKIYWRSVEELLRYGDFSISLNDGRTPSWICCVHVWITHEKYLAVFITVQNLAGIDVVVATPKRQLTAQKHITRRIDR